MISLLYAGDKDILREATSPSAVFWYRAKQQPARCATAVALALVLAIVVAVLVLGPEGTAWSWARRDTFAIVVSAVAIAFVAYMGWLFLKLLPGRNDRIVLSIRDWVRAEVDPVEEALRALSPEALRGKTTEFRKRLEDGESPDAIRAEAYACVREASRRAREHRQFECQLIGGRVIENCNVAEMRTGEGKTIVCYMANYMKVLQGLKVHMVTVNDYLVKRDAEFCKPIFDLLGVSVGYITTDMQPWGAGVQLRQQMYAAEITYGTNSEFGFDYLRDNMKNEVRDQVQGRQDFAVVDEVDSVLIDEARTPLIISGPAHDDVKVYSVADNVARMLMRKQEQANREMAVRVPDLESNPPAHAKGEAKFRDGLKKFKSDPLWLSSDEAEAIGHKQYFVVELDRKSAHMTEHGAKAAQAELGIGSFYDSKNMNWPHYMDNALRAHMCYQRDKEYVIQEDAIVIVDEFTGRLMTGRQWSDGLHQAVEAKERVTIKQETQTFATITLQNLFKLYKSLAGMTGTAMTESDEFMKIYKLEVVAIPTNKAVRRIDYNDKIFKSLGSKFDAIVEEIHAYSGKGYPADPWSLYDMLREARRLLTRREAGESTESGGSPDGAEPIADVDRKVAAIDEALALFKDGEGDPARLEPAYLELAGERYGGRPILVGTVAVETSEKLSNMLTRTHGIEHEVLNAKNHAREAEIVSKAGQQHLSARGKQKNMCGNVTIATNMAGRGTDIRLGPGVAHLGGLHVVGTERHESRRIDNQLRGRCGRQGDPGSSRFFLSFEDDLIRLFMGEWMLAMLNRFALEEGVPIEHRSLNKGIERAQKKVEERNFGIRKNLLEYDEVPDQQRRTFYEMRQRILEGRELSEFIWNLIDETVTDAVSRFYDPQFPAHCAAEWAGQHLGIAIDSSKLDTNEPALIRDTVRDQAVNETRSHVQRTLGEYVDAESDPDDWDVRGLINWIAQYGMTLTERKARELGPDALMDQITQAALRKIESVDLAPLEQYCDRMYGRTRLVRWAHDKFGLNIAVDELRTASPEEAEKVIGERMRAAYRKREEEYPVQAVIDYAIQRGGSNVNAVYDQIAKWVNLKFRLNWSHEHLAGKGPLEIFNELRALNADFLRNGRLDKELDVALTEHPGDAIVAWAKSRFGPIGANLKLNPDEDVREQLRRCGYEMFRYELTQLERMVTLSTLDSLWKDNMYSMDLLRSGINLRGYAERDPKIEFKREGTRLFNEMLSNIRERVTDLVFKVQVNLGGDDAGGDGDGGIDLPPPPSAPSSGGPAQGTATKLDATNAGFSTAARDRAAESRTAGPQDQQPATPIEPIRREAPKVGRNDPCPCGSGKKYKQCHGRGKPG